MVAAGTEHPVLVAIVTAIGTVLAAWGVAFIKGWLDRRESRTERRELLDGLERAQQAYELLASIRRDTSASRVLLLAGHNGGGVPRPDSPFYTSAMFWSVDDDAQQTIMTVGQYKQISVDAEYIRMLLDCEKAGVLPLDVGRMPPCQLKRYYQAEGVKHSLICFLGIKDRKFIYASVAKHGDAPFTDAEVTIAELRCEAVKRLI